MFQVYHLVCEPGSSCSRVIIPTGVSFRAYELRVILSRYTKNLIQTCPADQPYLQPDWWSSILTGEYIDRDQLVEGALEINKNKDSFAATIFLCELQDPQITMKALPGLMHHKYWQEKDFVGAEHQCISLWHGIKMPKPGERTRKFINWKRFTKFTAEHEDEPWMPH